MPFEFIGNNFKKLFPRSTVNFVKIRNAKLMKMVLDFLTRCYCNDIKNCLRSKMKIVRKFDLELFSNFHQKKIYWTFTNYSLTRFTILLDRFSELIFNKASRKNQHSFFS